MLEARITKHFHRNEGVMRAGDVVHETMPFVDFKAMNDFGEGINANHANVPYAITSAYVDDRNFICFDMREIMETYGDLPYNELQ